MFIFSQKHKNFITKTSVIFDKKSLTLYNYNGKGALI